MKLMLVIPILAAGAFACASAAAQPEKPPPRGPPAFKAEASAPAPEPGKQVFDRWCAACHAAGPRYPGTASLAVKYGKDAPAALEQRTDLTPDTVGYFVRHGVLIMPPFRKTEISDAELRALGDYLSHKSSK